MNVAKITEHTLLKPDATSAQIKLLCQEALLHEFYGVCIPPYFVRETARSINERMKIVTVVGFPMGFSTIPAKVEEIKKAFNEGCDEVDAVVSIAAVKSGNWAYVKTELESMMRAVAMRGKILKLIIEPSFLTNDEIKKVLEIATSEGVQYIKTSTGFFGHPTTVEQVKFIRANLTPKIKIKASGGIKTIEQIQKLVAAGADRIGTSNGVKMLTGIL
jgi:deoxyribose-phosphate aldolase